MKYIKLSEEFVPIGDYKNWSKFSNKDFYNEIGKYFKNFPDHDKNYNRIYFDLDIDPDRFKISIPLEISDYMRWYGYPIIDYERGVCQDKDGREIRIGRLFIKLGEEGLLQAYNNSKQNMLKNVKDLQVVISRHPYDIIGMSTNRGWTTCHDINDKRYKGHHLHGLKQSLISGSLIAYLIRKSDRNITNPISRCLLSAYNNTEFRSKSIYVDNHVYGTKVPEFLEFLVKWADNFNNNL